MARLVWRQVDGRSTTFNLGRSSLLGRGSKVDCVLDSSSVSRRHARIEQREHSYYLLDLGSTNGTLVNGERVDAETALNQGDQIRVGDEVLEFDQGPPPDSLTSGSMLTEPLSDLVTATSRQRVPVRKDAHEVLPRRVGRFYLLEKLGQGGMGTVYRAIDLDSNRQLAVKFIRSQIRRREDFLELFHNREAVLAREIDHPNVIQVYEYGIDGNQHFISMEYVSGENLYYTMKLRQLRPGEVLEILRQIACGLAAAHRQGVVHSDIKPANILLSSLSEEEIDGDLPGDHHREGEDATEGILEFGEDAIDDDESERERETSRRYDDGLLEEIRRRVGGATEDVFVDPPYFERRSELGLLEFYMSQMLDRRGGYVVIVEGEAGTGKDRLVSRFLENYKETAAASGGLQSVEPFPLYELDCSRVEGLPLFYEQVFGVRLRSEDAARSMVDDLLRHFESGEDSAVIRALNLGSAAPVFTDFIARIAKLFPERRLFLIATVNSEELRKNGALRPLFERIQPVAKELYLRPLTEYQIQRYLQQTFRNALPEIGLARDLYRLSGGNFARLLDIIRSFFERGVLRMDSLSSRVTYRPRAQEFELEEGKNLHEKYRALGKVERRVLEHAAFGGPRFLFDTLLQFHDIDDTALFFIVRTMLAEEFFVEESRTWYGFTNLAFQRYIADLIPASERSHHHRKVSRLLESVPVPESAELFQLRANHFFGCREYPKGVGALLQGAHLARVHYKTDLCRELLQEILRVVRLVSNDQAMRKKVNAVLVKWFRRSGNWYEILSQLASQPNVARVKIADFGISFRVRDHVRGYRVERKSHLGTPRYMAPDRAKGDSGGPKADIFSLGIIAYEMLVGGPPFPGAKGAEVIKANQQQKIVCPEEALVGYPAEMSDLIAGMLERDPERRWDAERLLRTIAKLQLDLETRAK